MRENKNNTDNITLNTMKWGGMKAPLISVILPCYNVAPYLPRCMKSLEEQSIGIENLELIFVDDASTDDGATWNAILDFEAKYPNQVIAIQHEENKKQGGARNTGLRYASAEYVGFVDPDDWIERDMYKALYDKAVEHDCEVVWCRMYTDADTTKELKGITTEGLSKDEIEEVEAEEIKEINGLTTEGLSKDEIEEVQAEEIKELNGFKTEGLSKEKVEEAEESRNLITEDLSKEKAEKKLEGLYVYEKSAVCGGNQRAELAGSGVFTKLYRKNLILDNEIWFPEKVFYEDNYWGTILACYVKRYYAMNDYLYHYCIRENSTAHLKNATQHLDYLLMEERTVDKYKEIGIFERFYREIEMEFLVKYYLKSIGLWAKYDHIPYELYRVLCEGVAKKFPDYPSNPYLQLPEYKFLKEMLPLSGKELSEEEWFLVGKLLKG
ncbi:hypothetical protein FACS1894111_05240 [Clostridia bacterium]|nr:hypothetical protein FACS1894111_05240 [Clostridia bacterium]